MNCANNPRERQRINNVNKSHIEIVEIITPNVNRITKFELPRQEAIRLKNLQFRDENEFFKELTAL